MKGTETGSGANVFFSSIGNKTSCNALFVAEITPEKTPFLLPSQTILYQLLSLIRHSKAPQCAQVGAVEQ